VLAKVGVKTQSALKNGLNLSYHDGKAVEQQIIACEAICPKTGSVPYYLPFVFFQERITSRRKQTENHHSKELVYLRP
jgi:hypothetical protein